MFRYLVSQLNFLFWADNQAFLSAYSCAVPLKSYIQFCTTVLGDASCFLEFFIAPHKYIVHCCLFLLHTPLLPNPLTVTSCFNIKVLDNFHRHMPNRQGFPPVICHLTAVIKKTSRLAQGKQTNYLRAVCLKGKLEFKDFFLFVPCLTFSLPQGKVHIL